jgi:hypothetical protein
MWTQRIGIPARLKPTTTVVDINVLPSRLALCKQVRLAFTGLNAQAFGAKVRS